MLCCFFLSTASQRPNSTPYYGVRVGTLSTLDHEVEGTVYIVDNKRLHIPDFTYDGEGPGKCRDCTVCTVLSQLHVSVHAPIRSV